MADNVNTLKGELEAIQKEEAKIVINRVANFAYTDDALEDNDANGHTDYDFNRDNNIPTPDVETLKVNETILTKGFRSQASSVTRMLMNHFLGRVSFNLNQTAKYFSQALGKITSFIGQPNGIASLDENGRIPSSQLPESSIEFKGFWNASANTPELEDGTGVNGDFYICNVAGTWNNIQFFVNDRIMYDGTTETWGILPAGNIQSVNGVTPVDSNVQITIRCTYAQWQAQVTAGTASGKFFIITDRSDVDQTLINDSVTANDATWSSNKITSYIKTSANEAKTVDNGDILAITKNIMANKPLPYSFMKIGFGTNKDNFPAGFDSTTEWVLTVSGSGTRSMVILTDYGVVKNSYIARIWHTDNSIVWYELDTVDKRNTALIPKTYFIRGEVFKDPSGTSAVKGIGYASVTLLGSFAKIEFYCKITVGGTVSSNTTWGLFADHLKALNANIPTITPITSGDLNVFRNNIIADGVVGYGAFMDNNTAGKCWTPARIYNDSGAYGRWGETIAQVGDLFKGTCYGTF